MVKRTTFRHISRRLCLGAGVGFLIGCSALDVSNPSIIEEQSLNNASGANLMRLGAIKSFASAVSATVAPSALVADELFAEPGAYEQSQGIHTPEQLLDMRKSELYEASGQDGGYFAWQDVRRLTTVAIPKLRAYAPDGAKNAHVGEMFALRGLAVLYLAENYCPGFPLHDVVDLKPVLGGPVTTDSAFRRALADFDSAAMYGADSTRILHLAHIGRARALLGLGRFADAGDAVVDVPVDYTYVAEYPLNASISAFFPGAYGVSSHEGGNGQDYVAAHDPRLPLDSIRTGYDSATVIYHPHKYANGDHPLVVASGVEAQLIRAEAALQRNDGTAWNALLNDLRHTQISPALADVTDPGTLDGRVDTLFSERAFWLYGTLHRLGDLRRLVAQYDRSPDQVFPTGAYRLGDFYGTATSIPFPAISESPYSPTVTGCTSR